MEKEKVLLFFGGGQADSGNYAIGFTAGELRDQGKIPYGIRDSFMGMTEKNSYEVLTEKKIKKMKNTLGTYLGTCRHVNLTKEETSQEAVNMIKSHGIKTVFVFGGDGSLRAVSELINKCPDSGINFVFVLVTLDGATGTDTIGSKNVVKEISYRVECMAADCFAIKDRDFLGTRVAGVELQGRNRNDPLIKSVQHLMKKKEIGHYMWNDTKTIMIPAGYRWSLNNVVNDINKSTGNTLVLMSEGAEPIEEEWKSLTVKGIGAIERKVREQKVRDMRCDIIGYLSQINGLGEEGVDAWCAIAIYMSQTIGGSFVVTKNNGKFEPKSYEEMVKLNQNSTDPIPLTRKEERLFAKYLPLKIV